MILAWLIVAALLATFGVITGFIVVFTVKRLLDSGIECPSMIKAVAYCWLVIGGISDFLFNVIVGTLMFRERPHEWVFTARIQRHLRDAKGWRYRKALVWGKVLVAVDPSHVDLPAG
jgi:hypothetical protein